MNHSYVAHDYILISNKIFFQYDQYFYFITLYIISYRSKYLLPNAINIFTYAKPYKTLVIRNTKLSLVSEAEV